MICAPLTAVLLLLTPFLAAPVPLAPVPPAPDAAPDAVAPDGDAAPAPDGGPGIVIQIPEAAPGGRPERPQRPDAQAEAEAEEEQTPADRRAALNKLYAELTAAPTEEAAAATAAQIESLWEASGSATADLLSERATAAMVAEDPDMAARHLDDALRFAPDFAEGWVRRGQLYSAAGEHSEAVVALQNALTADPQHYAALMTLAQTLESMESIEGAYDAYGEVLKVYPFQSDALEERARLQPLIEGREL